MRSSRPGVWFASANRSPRASRALISADKAGIALTYKQATAIDEISGGRFVLGIGTGDEASKPGFDSIALWARTGLMDLVRPSPDAAPARSLPGMGDHPTGTALFGAIMAALYQRERTGRGAMVSTSLLANGLWLNAIAVQVLPLSHPLHLAEDVAYVWKLPKATELPKEVKLTVQHYEHIEESVLDHHEKWTPDKTAAESTVKVKDNTK